MFYLLIISLLLYILYKLLYNKEEFTLYIGVHEQLKDRECDKYLIN